MIELHSVTFEHHRDSIGIGEAAPRISWKFKGDAKDWFQSGYDLEITYPNRTVGTIESFSVQSSDSVLQPWPTTPLTSRERAIIRVKAHGKDGGISTSWSEPATVEVGLLERKDWSATMIGAPRVLSFNDSLQPSLFRKKFKINEKVKSARVYMTSHGAYEAHLNGTRIGNHEFAPGWTSYNHYLNYQTYDVSDLLTDGENVITVEVGEGWFCTRLGFGGGQRNIYADQLALLFQLEVTFENDKTIVVNSDESWRTNNGPIISSEIYDGEMYDANRRQDWYSLSFDDSSWKATEALAFPTPQLVASKGPPVRRMETLQPQKIWKSPTGKAIVDFGQNLVGWVQVRVTGSKNQKIVLTHTEVLEEGECATRPLRRCKAQDTLILSGEPIRWEPKFTFHGFRYVQVEGWPSESGEPAHGDISAVVLHTDMERTGFFECSDTMINKLHENIIWGMKGNFLSIPTDCPQRDERLGWTGDIQIFSPTASFLYDTSGMLSGWLQDLAAEQLKDYDGVPPLVCPNVIKDPFPKTQAAWADVAVILPYDLYNAFGDQKLLLDQYLSMKTWISKALPRGPTGLWDANTHQLGDWLDPAAPPSEPGNGRTDPHLVANAYLVHITDIMAKVSLLLNLQDDHLQYTKEAASVRTAFQEEYITPNGRLAPDTMTSLSLALSYNLFRSALETRNGASRLAKIVRAASFKIGTGFVGTPLILPALTSAGHAQLAYRMLHEKRCPSWLYPLTMGATTMWERWDSMLPDGRVNPGSMTSFNHYALGSVGDWLHGSVGGLAIGEAGWRRVRVRPVPGGEIRWAKCVFEGPYGTVGCQWSVSDGSFRMRVEVPPNSTAEVLLPSEQEGRVVGSGVHHFGETYVEPEWPPLAITDIFSS